LNGHLRDKVEGLTRAMKESGERPGAALDDCAGLHWHTIAVHNGKKFIPAM